MARHFTNDNVSTPCVGRYTFGQSFGGAKGYFEYFEFDKNSNPDRKTVQRSKLKIAVFDTAAFKIGGSKFANRNFIGQCYSNFGMSPSSALKVFWSSNGQKTMVGHGKWADIKTKVEESTLGSAKYVKVILGYDVTNMPKGGNPADYPMVQLEVSGSMFTGWKETFESHATVIGDDKFTVRSEMDIAKADEKGFSLLLAWDEAQVVPPTGTMTYCYPYFKAYFTADEKFREADKRGVADTDAWLASEAKKAEFDFELDDAVAASSSPAAAPAVAFTPVPANQQTMANVPDDDLPF